MLKNTDVYYIAVDGGASKTEFCVYNLITKEEKHFFSGGTNFKNAGVNVKKNLIDKGIHLIFKEMGICPEQIKGLAMGLSGCDSQRDHDFLMGIADFTGISREKIYIGNDCELAFFSEGTPPGLGIVAGTGSIATGFSAEYKKGRSGGWGSPIGDEGSGAWIGISVVRDMLRYCDGYGDYQPIFSIIRDHMGGESFDVMPGVLSVCTIKEIAGIAKFVMDEAEKGDCYCDVLMSESARLIAEIAASVYEKLNFSQEQKVDVVMLGSLFKSTLLSQKFKEHLVDMAGKNNINFCGQNKSPVMGGIAFARIWFNRSN